MTPYLLYEGIKAAIQAEIDADVNRLRKGSWRTLEEGKEICGRLKGYDNALYLAQQELNKLEQTEGDIDLDPAG